MKIRKTIAYTYLRYKLNILHFISPSKAGRTMYRLICSPYEKPKKGINGSFDQAEKLQTKLEGLKVNGYRINAGDYRKKVLIVHGFSSQSRNFQHFVKPLTDMGFEVIAFDAPAHGTSEGKLINADLYAKLISQVNKEFGPIDHFIGHSLGGLALALALENLELTEHNKLVLIAPATETTTFIDTVFTTIGVKTDKLKHLLHKEIQKMTGKGPEWFSVSRAVKNVKANILWIHDNDDIITPVKDALKVFEFRLPHIQFHFTESLGHQRIYRNDQVLALIGNFLHEKR